MCVYLCMCVRDRQRERGARPPKFLKSTHSALTIFLCYHNTTVSSIFHFALRILHLPLEIDLALSLSFSLSCLLSIPMYSSLPLAYLFLMLINLISSQLIFESLSLSHSPLRTQARNTHTHAHTYTQRGSGSDLSRHQMTSNCLNLYPK